ncbi:MAG: pantoate--beta-alanine ligase [Saprospiraceae bacterium]
MKLFKKVSELRYHLNQLTNAKKTIGFVPTMGALHQGHLSLVERAKAKNDFVVVSIFVNPTQFNETSDLTTYPRTPVEDINKLIKSKCDFLFYPTSDDVYPPGLDTSVDVDFGILDTVMEGEHRPGHFVGVAQVVKRLLEIVEPTRLYLGQKDFQQFTIIKHMVKTLNMEVKTVRCPIVREKDGLAMSSRNVRLTPEHRAVAPQIRQVLLYAREMAGTYSPADIKKICIEQLDTKLLQPEYFEIVDRLTLEPLKEQFDFVRSAVACTAIWAGDVRLIDNIILF